MSEQADLTQSQLFLDDTWIAAQRRLQRCWYPAEVHPEPVLRPEEPWEGTVLVLYGTVLQVGDTYRMYYATYNPPRQSLVCVAESDDGLRWRRPVVGEVEYQGSKENNIVLPGPVHPSVTHDPDDAAAPFKMVWYEDTAIRAATSPDGYRWTRSDTPLVSPVGDVQNILLDKVDGEYVILAKPFETRQRYGARIVGFTRSADFRDFPRLDIIQQPDLIDAPAVEYYGMTAFPYAGLYLGLLWRYNGLPDFIDMLLTWSYDLKEWQLPTAREAFIGPAQPWNSMWSSSASGPPIRIGNHLWFYFGGRSRGHGQNPLQYGAVGLATIAVDRFVSLTAGHIEGQVVTKPMTWPGGDLQLNASTTRHLTSHPTDGGGTLFVDVLDSAGQQIDGFAGSNRAEFAGNVPSRHRGSAQKEARAGVVRWGEGRSLNELAGQQITLAFSMRDSHLYSFRSSG